MDMQSLVRELKIKNDNKIVMLVADGLGGLPIEPKGPTELEAAKTPNLDALAKQGVQGLMNPIAPGITPGSGPGHLGLFGYDPVKYLIGRGALEATGVGFKLGPKDVADPLQFLHARCRRETSPTAAPAESPARKADPLAIKLRQVKIPKVEIFVEPVKEHRFVRHLPRRRPGRKRGRYRSAKNRRSATRSRGRTINKARPPPKWQSSSSPRPGQFWPTSPRPTD